MPLCWKSSAHQSLTSQQAEGYYVGVQKEERAREWKTRNKGTVKLRKELCDNEDHDEDENFCVFLVQSGMQINGNDNDLIATLLDFYVFFDHKTGWGAKLLLIKNRQILNVKTHN